MPNYYFKYFFTFADIYYMEVRVKKKRFFIIFCDTTKWRDGGNIKETGD